MKQQIIAIAAIDKTGAIGYQNQLLFKDKDDLKHFYESTKGCPILLGRKTFESIGKPLKDRQVFVLTSNKDYKAESATVVNDIQSFLTAVKDSPKVFIAGGGEVYHLTMHIWTDLYLTIFDKVAQRSDAHFPKWYNEHWIAADSGMCFDNFTIHRYSHSKGCDAQLFAKKQRPSIPYEMQGLKGCTDDDEMIGISNNDIFK